MDGQLPYPSAQFVEQHLSICRGEQYVMPSMTAGSVPVANTKMYYEAVRQFSGDAFRLMQQQSQQVYLQRVPSVPCLQRQQRQCVMPSNRLASTQQVQQQQQQMKQCKIPSIITCFPTSTSSCPIDPDTNDEIDTRNSNHRLNNNTPVFGCSSSSASSQKVVVHSQDRHLITDYFTFLLSQYRITKFVEADRKCKNNGKRKNLKVNFGGMECRHCGSCSNRKVKSRKFFWSSVDRMANSLSEFPNHLMKCKAVPQSVLEDLHRLKTSHNKQMARIPRGSQKVYLRRLWRRMQHDFQKEQDKLEREDGWKASVPRGTGALTAPQVSDVSTTALTQDDSVSCASSVTTDPAIIATDDLIVTNADNKVLLCASDDAQWLSDADCFIRKNLEVFHDENKGIGIRCLHCSHTTDAVYPSRVEEVIDVVKAYSRNHFKCCGNENIRKQYLQEFSECKSSKSLKVKGTLTKILRQHYLFGCREVLKLENNVNGENIIPMPSSVLFNRKNEESPCDRKMSGSPTGPLDMFATIAVELQN